VARAFIAVTVPPLPALLRALGELRDMGPALRPPAPENLHLTLRFLGETPAASLDAVAASVRASVADLPAFDFELYGTGVFPDPARPSVLWAGARGAQPLADLVACLAPPLETLGFAPETRPWVAHLTLARIRSRPPAELHRFLEKTRDRSFGSVHVAHIDLMLSDLTPHGPQYHLAASLELK
jgi:2'-5' RNA ligase